MRAREGKQSRTRGVMGLQGRHDGMAGVQGWGLGLERRSRLQSCQITKKWGCNEFQGCGQSDELAWFAVMRWTRRKMVGGTCLDPCVFAEGPQVAGGQEPQWETMVWLESC